MASIFNRIINGEIPCHKIAETANYIAFLDVRPLVRGHVLVIPKQEIPYIFDLDDTLLSGLHLFAKKIAKAIEQAIPCKKVGMAVIGLEVPHAHIHLIPLTKESDIYFSNTKLQLEDAEMASIAQSIKQFLD
jgi:histidine triad (HIT) family protein